ncbi:Cytochrome P450 82A1 [Vitis vinifera]|uniref:Cytochrome P450 82A1 n=1 Tax=Vitis vinifera TaxID=29760 RepID=A0A438FMY2_VITVI|nr:Cytochrome P450 82A1 [Vitis vinifera]
MEDCTMAGFHIQAGTRLLVNLWKLHKDPRIWLDPLEFQPEKFLTKHVDLDVRGQNFEFLPFGSGRRDGTCVEHEFLLGSVLVYVVLSQFGEVILSPDPFSLEQDQGRQKATRAVRTMASLIGHLHLLGANKLLHQKLGDMADKYGPIFCIHLGFSKALVVSRWEVAKECYTTNDKREAMRSDTESSLHCWFVVWLCTRLLVIVLHADEELHVWALCLHMVPFYAWNWYF